MQRNLRNFGMLYNKTRPEKQIKSVGFLWVMVEENAGLRCLHVSGLHHRQFRHKCWSDGDLPDKKHESKVLFPRLLQYEVPTVTTNSSLDINTELLDAKAAAVNATCPMSRNTKAQTETSTSNGPATYPDGGMADEMPGEPRAKSARSWHDWDNNETLKFIQDTIYCKCGIDVPGLENGGAKIVEDNWTRHIPKEILKAMQIPRVKKYDGSSVKDLLRFIKNAYTYYHQLPEDVKTELGRPRSKILDYFKGQFPKLLPHTYSVMEHFKDEDDFRSYYKIK